MADKNQIVPILDKFGKQWDKLYVPVVNLISKKINEGMGISSAVDFAFNKYGIEKEFRSLALNTILQSAEIGGVNIKSELGIKRFFLDKHWEGDKFTLAEKLSALQFRPMVKNEILRNFRAGNTVLQTAKSLTDKNLIEADIPKYINNLLTSARRLTVGDTTALQTYKSAITKAGNQIESLAEREGASTRLKKAYQNIVRASENLKTDQLDKAIDRAIRAKARYNAERLVRTEGARAYGSAKITEADTDPDAVGLKWSLSSGHTNFDICDFNAEANLYSLGKGVYPKDSLPEYPAHPHCLCIVDIEYGEKQLEGKFDSTAAKEYINDLSDTEKNRLLGGDNIKTFINDVKKTSDNLSNIPDKLIE